MDRSFRRWVARVGRDNGWGHPVVRRRTGNSGPNHDLGADYPVAQSYANARALPFNDTRTRHRHLDGNGHDGSNRGAQLHRDGDRCDHRFDSRGNADERADAHTDPYAAPNVHAATGDGDAHADGDAFCYADWRGSAADITAPAATTAGAHCNAQTVDE